jgi:uncharacterized protein (DUF302 family)
MINKIMIKKFKSKYGYKETIEKLKNAIVSNGWSIPSEHNMEEKVGKKIYIIELCKQEYAKQALEKEQNYWITAMMPCRIGICEEKDGVYLYTMNIKFMSVFLHGDLKKVFKNVAEEEEKIIKELIE